MDRRTCSYTKLTEIIVKFLQTCYTHVMLIIYSSFVCTINLIYNFIKKVFLQADLLMKEFSCSGQI